MPTSQESIADIGSLKLFERCGRQQRSYIDRVSTVVEVRARSACCRQGEVGREFFVVLTGSLVVLRNGALVATLGAGDWFGELALDWRAHRSASVWTLQDSRLLVFSTREYRSLRRACQSVAETIDAVAHVRLLSLRRETTPAPKKRGAPVGVSR